MVFADILEEVESHPVDITISTVTVQNGSESLTTLGGTKVLRANKKLCHLTKIFQENKQIFISEEDCWWVNMQEQGQF
jgi:hypothetical protein